MKDKKRLFQRRTPSERALFVLVFVVFAAFAFSYVYMIAWCFISGARTHLSISQAPFGFSELHFEHYIEVFSLMTVNGNSFVMMLINSMYFCMLGPLLCMTVTSMMAYVTAKYKFFGSKAVYVVVLVVITLPVYGSTSSMYRLLYNLHFLNSRLMIFTSLNAFSIYYMYFYAFYKGISWSYAEAAQIDGANNWLIYFKIMLPQAMTMFGSLYLLLWLTEWNSYATALIYLPKMPTLALGIYQVKEDLMHDERMDILYAACFISLIPPLLMFACFNNALMSNISLGGIKE